MKKLVYGVVIIITALTMSYLFVNQSLFANPFNQPEERSYYFNLPVFTYEQLYMHLYEEDKALLDLDFAQSLKDADIHQMVLEDALVELDTIKQSLVLEYETIFDGTYRTYGMMGGRGYACHNNINIESYEFYYIHQSYSTRQLIDEQFLTRLSTYDLSTLDTGDIVIVINQIKTEILLDFTNN